METKSQLANIYRSVLTSLSTKEGKQALFNGLNENFTNGENPLVQTFGDLDNLFDKHPAELSPKDVGVFYNSAISLDKMYQQKNRRNKFTFNISLILVGITLGTLLLIILKWAIFGAQFDQATTMINLIFTGVPALSAL